MYYSNIKTVLFLLCFTNIISASYAQLNKLCKNEVNLLVREFAELNKDKNIDEQYVMFETVFSEIFNTVGRVVLNSTLLSDQKAYDKTTEFVRKLMKSFHIHYNVFLKSRKMMSLVNLKILDRKQYVSFITESVKDTLQEGTHQKPNFGIQLVNNDIEIKAHETLTFRINEKVNKKLTVLIEKKLIQDQNALLENEIQSRKQTIEEQRLEAAQLNYILTYPGNMQKLEQRYQNKKRKVLNDANNSLNAVIINNEKAARKVIAQENLESLKQIQNMNKILAMQLKVPEYLQKLSVEFDAHYQKMDALMQKTTQQLLKETQSQYQAALAQQAKEIEILKAQLQAQVLKIKKSQEIGLQTDPTLDPDIRSAASTDTRLSDLVDGSTQTSPHSSQMSVWSNNPYAGSVLPAGFNSLI